MLNTITSPQQAQKNPNQTKIAPYWLSTEDFYALLVNYSKSYNFIKDLTFDPIFCQNEPTLIDIKESTDIIPLGHSAIGWSFKVDDLISPYQIFPANQDKKITVETTKRYSLLDYVQKIYISEKKGYINLDIILNILYYTNQQLNKLLDKELEIRDLFNNPEIDFNYINCEQNIFYKNCILIYEK